MDAHGEPYTSVRCSAVLPDGSVCGATIWRARNGLVEVAHGLRAGRRFEMWLPIEAARQTQIPCLRCGTRWWPSDLLEPLLVVDGESGVAVIALRPVAEAAGVREHNRIRHKGEAA